LPILLTSAIPDCSGFERVVVATSAIGGSLFSPWLRFKGGKGIGTSLGAISVLAPIPMLASVVVFVIFLFAFNYVSMASLIAAAILPVSIFALEWIRGIKHDPVLLVFAVLVALSLIVMHRANILRLANGTEARFFNREK
jgi:acyl phosphate:glycerol-3-phosphate acyltransferase